MCPNQPHRCKPFCNASIFFRLTEKRQQITSNYATHIASSLYKLLPSCALSLSFQPKSKHEDRDLLSLSKSSFLRYFTHTTCVNNVCITSDGGGHVLSENVISVAIWQLVWHREALSQPKLVPTNPSLPYTLLILCQLPPWGESAKCFILWQ